MLTTANESVGPISAAGRLAATVYIAQAAAAISTNTTPRLILTSCKSGRSKARPDAPSTLNVSPAMNRFDRNNQRSSGNNQYASTAANSTLDLFRNDASAGKIHINATTHVV